HCRAGETWGEVQRTRCCLGCLPPLAVFGPRPRQKRPDYWGRRDVGSTQEVREMAREWVRMKDRQATLPAGKRAGTRGGLPLLADSRIDDLRDLSTPDFEFRKLIRLCEELYAAYNNGCYFAALSN